MTPGTHARRRTAVLAVVAAGATGALAALLGGSAATAWAGLAYVALTLVALARPAAIGGQVVFAQLLAVGLVWGPDGVPAGLLLPVVAGAVASAELLAAAARLAPPLPAADPGAGLREAGVATGVAAGIFAVVLLLAGLPGPSGLLALALASGACVVLAALVVRSAGEGRRR